MRFCSEVPDTVLPGIRICRGCEDALAEAGEYCVPREAFRPHDTKRAALMAVLRGEHETESELQLKPEPFYWRCFWMLFDLLFPRVYR